MADSTNLQSLPTGLYEVPRVLRPSQCYLKLHVGKKKGLIAVFTP